MKEEASERLMWLFNLRFIGNQKGLEQKKKGLFNGSALVKCIDCKLNPLLYKRLLGVGAPKAGNWELLEFQQEKNNKWGTFPILFGSGSSTGDLQPLKRRDGLKSQSREKERLQVLIKTRRCVEHSLVVGILSAVESS